MAFLTFYPAFAIVKLRDSGSRILPSLSWLFKKFVYSDFLFFGCLYLSVLALLLCFCYNVFNEAIESRTSIAFRLGLSLRA